MKRILRKRRTRQHIIADLSVNHVERQALLSGFVVERLVFDYGIDLELFTFNRHGEIEEGKVLLQIKATDRLKIPYQKPMFPFRVSRTDLVSWLGQPMPVILVVFDARADGAYWLYVQSYFRRHPEFNLFTAGKEVTVQIPTINVVNRVAMKRFRSFRDRVLRQLKEVVHDET